MIINSIPISDRCILFSQLRVMFLKNIYTPYEHTAQIAVFSSFRSADDEAAEAYLGGRMISTESQTESRKRPIKAGTIVTLGILLLLH